VAAHAKTEQRLRIFLHVEESPVVTGPDRVVLDVWQSDAEIAMRRQVHDFQHVLPPTNGVDGVRHEPAVGADRDLADLVEVVAAREHVHIEQNFFRGIRRGMAPCIDGILLAGLEAAVVPVAVLEVRHGRVVLLQAADDLGVHLRFEWLGVREHRIGVGILRPHVREHVGVFAPVVAQPVIVVLAGAVR
jgi:hypothetical protein